VLGPVGIIATLILIIQFGNPLLRRKQRRRVPDLVLARHRPVPASEERLHPPLVPPDRSVVLASAEGALTRDTVAHGEMSGSQELILRFNNAPHGSLAEV
jgi:hypothetical protein